MSDDPLLTSLCGICHIREPKYKCPRCGAKTCSLACVKKHKNWSSCSGERDPTVFIPAAQLRTDRGIDHDYNFLHKLERQVEVADKIFTEERGILPQQKQDSRPNKRARLQKGQSRGNNTLGDGLRPWARAALSRLRKLGISVEHAPYGMTRAKENKTQYNHKLRVINWQIEWLLLDSDDRPSRLLSRAPDTTPLYQAFGDCQWHRLSKEEKDAEKKAQKAKSQDNQLEKHDELEEISHGLQQPTSNVWHETVSIMQHSSSGRWNISSDRRSQAEKEQGLRHDKDKYKFFLGNPKDPSREAKKLVPIAATDSLETILKGVEVVEFPQIYVLAANFSLPEGYILHRPNNESKLHNRKRKNDGLVAYGSGSESDSDAGPVVEPSSKEEGELREDGDNDSGPEFEFENEEQQAEFLTARQASGHLNDDDTTSSSGSDSSDLDSEMDVD